MRKRTIFMIAVLLVFSMMAVAQRGHGHGRGNNAPKHRHPGKKTVVVHHSRYRPARVHVFHPHWHPGQAYHRRWVYFPRHNFYWDNWRNHYVFWNGTIWISQPAPPPALKDVDLQKEKQKELKEDEDDVDDVYKSNSEHKGDQ